MPASPGDERATGESSAAIAAPERSLAGLSPDPKSPGMTTGSASPGAARITELTAGDPPDPQTAPREASWHTAMRRSVAQSRGRQIPFCGNAIVAPLRRCSSSTERA